MSGNDILLDSNILIAISKDEDSLKFYSENYNTIYASIISYVEVLGYNFKNKNEKQNLNDTLNRIEIINMNFEIADIAIDIRKKNKIKLPDAIIYATAVYLDAELMTKNVDDFKNLN